MWNRSALWTITNFPIDVKREIGYLLFKLQKGEKLTYPFSRRMKILGEKCYELRVRGEDGIYRAFYLLKVKSDIVVFHAFQKKTQKTSKKEIEIGKKRLKKELENEKK